jgi:Tfp pilus assembly protein PilO
MSLAITERQKMLAAATGLPVVMALLVWLLYLPLVSRIGAHREALKNLGEKIAEARRSAQLLESKEEAMRQARARYLALERRIGDGQSLARILESLHLLAAEDRLAVVAVQPKRVESEQRELTLGAGITLQEIPLTLELEGRYRQLVRFFEKLPQASLIASIHQLRVTGPKAGHAPLRAEVTLAVYLAKQGHRS